MSERYDVLTFKGYRVFLEDFNSGTLPSILGSRLENVAKALETTIEGTVTKETDITTGFEYAGIGGTAVSDGSLSIMRVGAQVYNPSGTTAFDKLQKWTDECTGIYDGTDQAVNAGAHTKWIIEMISRGNNKFDAVAYQCIAKSFNPEGEGVNDLQKYTLGLAVYGKPIRCAVTYTPAVGTSAESYAISDIYAAS